MAIVLPLRKSSLRKMIQERHNNHEINLMVLEKLKPIVRSGAEHGDLKVIQKKIITVDGPINRHQFNKLKNSSFSKF